MLEKAISLFLRLFARIRTLPAKHNCMPLMGPDPRNILSGLSIGTAILFACGSPAIAATISTELVNSDTTITFDEIVLAGNTPIAANYLSLGVTFDGVFYDPANQFVGNLINGFSSHSAGNFTSFQGGHIQEFGIQFVNDVSAFSIMTLSNTQFTRFTALLDGNLVETVDAITGGAFNLIAQPFGFTSIIFDEVRIRSTATGNAQTFRFDTLRFNEATSVVPLPAALPLFGTGLGILGFLGWRRRRKSQAV